MSAPSPTRSGGIYVHFAYCARRCVYCDFALATPKSIPSDRYTDALIAELATTAHTLGGEARTLYVGGGTPSLWPPAELARFLAAARVSPGIAAGAEITLEANPKELDDAWLAAVTALGVNRISLGIQSLDDRELTALSRMHGAAGALAAADRLATAYAAGTLTSFSVDLMYGLPGQTLAAWIDQIHRLVDRIAPPHLSLYALTVEPTTVLGLRIRRGTTASPDDSLQADMMFGARDVLATYGYTHYEVSSWARPGHIARHNSAYWELRPWLGIGAGAHGFAAGRRTRNEARPSRYIERVMAAGHAEVEIETPDAKTLAFEHILTGLRRLDLGVTLPADLDRTGGAANTGGYEAIVQAEIAAGRLVREGATIRLTDLGLRFMDDVLLAFVP